MGFLHYNNTVDEQLAQALLCKRHVPALVLDPLVLGPQDTVACMMQLMVRSQPLTSPSLTVFV
jgi:IMP dehydrogenase